METAETGATRVDQSLYFAFAFRPAQYFFIYWDTTFLAAAVIFRRFLPVFFAAFWAAPTRRPTVPATATMAFSRADTWRSS